MIAFSYGLYAAVGFVMFASFVLAWMEMRFDQRSTVVFDMDGKRTEEELKIIHEYYLPIRGLVLVLTTLTADIQKLGPTIALFGVTVMFFWIVFDIVCAVVWLGKPWYYVGNPPPMNPYLFFFLKGSLFSLCLFTYFRWSLP